MASTLERYKEIIHACVDEISSSGGELVIYGASKLGWFVRAVMAHRGLKTVCFIDKSASVDFQDFHGTPVISLEQFQSIEKKHPIIVSIFNAGVACKVADELKNQKCTVIETDPYALLFDFFINVASRNCDREAFAGSIENLKRLYSVGRYTYGQIYDDLFVSPLVVGNVTQKCNLKCIDCGQFIPYYENPKSFEVRGLVNEIKSYCQSVDLVPEISLHGGEPFLHPKIGEICKNLAQIPNLIFINLITNGTVFPQPESWELFKNAGVDIHQSDYRRISKRQAPIFALCEENTIYCDINWTNEFEMWWRQSPIQNWNRSKQEDDNIYQKCVQTDICAQIMDGKLYRCPVAAHNIGKFPSINGKDHVSLTDGDNEDARKNLVRNYLTKTECLNACGYCDPFNNKLVTPALQLSPRNKAIIDAGGEVL